MDCRAIEDDRASGIPPATYVESAAVMKCQHCDKPATFHITELTEADGVVALHMCEEHARLYLAGSKDDNPTTSLADLLAKQLKIEHASREAAEVDAKTCPVCGITFAQFRSTGRLGCPNDYDFFRNELEPLLLNIHGATAHRGKRPRRVGGGSQQNELLQLRRELDQAVAAEAYERAGELRDRIKELELETGSAEGSDSEASGA